MDISALLAQVMSDENAMNSIRQMAQGMDAQSMGGLMDMLGGMGGIGGMGGSMGSGNDAQQCSAGGGKSAPCGDPNIELINALRPFLSTARRRRARDAVKILRMLEMLPMLQQSGLLQNLMGGDGDGDD